MPEYPNQPADVIQLLMCPDDIGNMVDSPAPQKRRDHIPPHVKSFVSTAGVDKNGLTIRQLNHGAISLPDIKECNTPPIAVRLRNGRTQPPTNQPYRQPNARNSDAPRYYLEACDK
jgi:hypothetical protein